jgi:hypothetical protein
MGHTPEYPSSLSDDCPDVIGVTLELRCQNGWGWFRTTNDGGESIEDTRLIDAVLEIVPEFYVALTRPRSGIAGRVLRAPEGYGFHRFIANIMSDGCDYDFSDNVAFAWRIWLGDGELDYEDDIVLGQFPTMTGTNVFHGYGSIAVPGHWAKDLRRWRQPSGLG